MFRLVFASASFILFSSVLSVGALAADPSLAPIGTYATIWARSPQRSSPSTPTGCSSRTPRTPSRLRERPRRSGFRTRGPRFRRSLRESDRKPAPARRQRDLRYGHRPRGPRRRLNQPQHDSRRGRFVGARAASRRGIEIHTIAVGPDAAGSSSRYAAIALNGGGTYLASRALPRTAPGFLSSPLRPTSIEVVNDTTGEPGRALRLQRDGRFDGFVRLQPGANRLAIRARTADGAQQGASRTVFFSPPARRTARDRDLLHSLRARAQEIADASPRGTRRTLEIEAER